MRTAQETMKRMLTDHVGPALREMGFRGSGQTYALPSDSHWSLLGFQRSKSSDRNRVSFTVNLTAVSRADWGAIHSWYPQLPERPGANWSPAPIFERVSETGYWHSRIGPLMPSGLDSWWDLRANDDEALIAAPVVEAVRQYGLPALRARAT